MKIHRNIALGVVEGLRQILEKKQALRPSLSQLLKQNRRWGSRDRRQLGESVLDCIRWKRTYVYLGNLDSQSECFFWELLGIWMLTKEMILPEWEELSSIKELKISIPLNLETTDRKIRTSLPDWLDVLGIENYGETIWEKESQSFNTPAALVLRNNTLKQDSVSLKKQLEKDFTIKSTEVADIPQALVLDKHYKLNQNPLYLNGAFEIQDANSQRVAHWVNPQSNHLIVDACAGSGGKSLHMAAMMQNQGRIFALDPHPIKLDQLKIRAKRNGISNIQTLDTHTPDFFNQQQGTADVVLIDAPCSGLGVLRRNPAAKWHMNPEKIKKVELLQRDILQKNAPLVKKGGALVYATCSIFPNENQYQIKHFLETDLGSEFELIKEETYLTHQTGFDGFYLARLEKKE